MTNPHAVRLEEERRFLWKRKRANKAFILNAHFLVADHIDRNERVRRAAVDLLWIEKQLEKVCFELGRDPHPPVVRLDVRPRPAAARAAPVRRSVQGYVTRDMGTWR